jgi:hypothetical protein
MRNKLRWPLAFGAFFSLFVIACGGGGGGSDSSSDSSSGNDGNETSAVEFPFDELEAPINSGSFLYRFINDDGYYYNFYGERDDRNVPQFINKLVLAKNVGSGRSVLFLQIEFDEHQRPIKIILPDALGMIEIEYINDLTAKATTTGPDGKQETVTVDHPFQLPTQASSEASVARGVISDTVCDQVTTAWVDKSIQILGNIEGCEGGPQPNVEIVGGVPPKSYYADLLPINVFGEDPSDWVYSVTIDTEIPVNFDTWVTYCECNITANIVLTAMGGNEVLDVAIATGEGLGNFIKDIQNESIVNTTKNTLGAVVDALTTGGTAETLGHLVDFAASGGTLPCTRARYDLEINTIENDYDAYCDFGSDSTKHKVFDPLTLKGPDFDWSGRCGDNGDGEDYVVWYMDNVRCWDAPRVYATHRDTFNLEEDTCDIPGGGMNCDIKVEKVEMQGGFSTLEAAQDWFCPQITTEWYHYWCNNRGARVEISGGALYTLQIPCDLTDVPYKYP